jgi:hypothetical protein
MALCEAFFDEAVGPIMARRFPGLPYSAARLGEGSDVLGYDTPQSMDHGWGPMVDVYLAPADFTRYAAGIKRVMGEELPFEFRGFSTSFDTTPSWVMTPTASRPVNHRVLCISMNAAVHSHRPVNPNREWTLLDWLAIPQQNLRLIRRGKVFHDGLGELEPMQTKLHYYPPDLWLYLLAAQWARIGQEEAFVARCGDVGDELGSRVIATRLIHDLVSLCFLMERQYAPYAKWFGTAFEELRCRGELTPIFQRVLDARGWKDREGHLSQAYEIIARIHNALGVTDPLAAEVRQFHDRPYMVIGADRFAEAIYQTIASDEVRRLPKNVGSLDQFVNSTDVLDSPKRRARLISIYGGKQ